MMIVSTVLFALSAFANSPAKLPQSLEQKVVAEANKSCHFFRIESLSSESESVEYNDGDQSWTDLYFVTTLDVQYNYDSHPNGGQIVIKSKIGDLYGSKTEVVGKASSRSVGLCE